MHRNATLAAQLVLAAAATLTLQPAAAYERQGAFVGGGLGIGTLNLSERGEQFVTPDFDDSTVALAAQGGYRFNAYFALEGGIAGGANDGDSTGDEGSIGGLTAFAVGLVPVGERVDLFGRVGFHTSSAEVGFSSDEDESGVAYGAGIQLNLGRRGNFGIRGEYTVLDCDTLLDDAQGFVVSFQYNFFRP